MTPRRPDRGRRDLLWAHVKAWWAENYPAWPIHEGLHLADEGPFNRAAGINRAAAQAGDWEIAVIVDGDVFASTTQIDAAVAHAAETGRMTLAYTTYQALTKAMTERVLRGYRGDWSRGVELTMDTHVSSIVVVPRALWDEVGGFDERFIGWGAEDAAFSSTCRVLAGGIDRVPGTVWHLWHPYSPERSSKSPDRVAGKHLANRYFDAVDPAAMRRLVAEKKSDPGDGIVQVIVTNGRRDCIAQAVASAAEHLRGPISRRVIVDDSGSIDYQAWLRHAYPDHDLITTGGQTGFDGAYRMVWETVLRSGQPWAFLIEEDFTFERDVDLLAMAAAMDQRPHLVQMALRRQAWARSEKAVGGIIEKNPVAYSDHSSAAGDWLEHREFVTTNPALWRRTLIAEFPWPTGTGSEIKFARTLFRNPDAAAGYWGARTDDPWVIHDGERIGTRY